MTDIRLARAEIEWRSRRIRTALNAADMDGLLVFAPAWRRENIRYLTDAALDAGAALAYFPSSGAPTAYACSAGDMQAMMQAGFLDDVRTFIAQI